MKMLSPKRSQIGLSLLEVVASLAVVSIVSVALFQSTIGWMEISSKSADAAERTISVSAQQEQFRILVKGLTFAWAETEEDKVFFGSRTGFRGITSTPLHTFTPALHFFSLQIQPRDQATVVNYGAEGVLWDLFEFSKDADLGFSYLDADGTWHPQWPPDVVRPSPQNALTALFQQPQLPSAIKLNVSGNDPQSWIANVGSEVKPPQTLRDLIQDEASP